jgi:hypothetical protein
MDLIQGSGRPDKGYFIEGSRVPSVTTVIGSCKSSSTVDALMYWAWKLGKEGVDFRERNKGAIDVGHITHTMVENFIRKLALETHKGVDYEEAVYNTAGYIRSTTPVDDPHKFARAKVAFEAFVEWIDMTRATIVATEVPLISKELQTGGTLDAVLKVNDKLYIGDWKTSNGLYADYLCQIATYKLLWEECYPQYPIDGGFHLVRFDKEHGDFEHRFFKSLDKEAEAFIYMRKLYGIMRKVERRVR